MKRWLPCVGFVLLVLLMAAFVALATWEPFFARQDTSGSSSGRIYSAEIIRDEFGCLLYTSPSPRD